MKKKMLAVFLSMIAAVLFNSCDLFAGLRTYTITYNGNSHTGGTVPVDNARYRENSNVIVAANTGSLVKQGYFFEGWTTQANATSQVYLPGSNCTVTNSNITFYAKWTKKFTVLYHGNGNTAGTQPIDSNEYESGEMVTVASNIGSLEKTGCAFDGWNEAADGNGVNYQPGASFTIHGDIVLYARWKAPHSVTYQGNGNSAGTAPIDPNTYLADSQVVILGNTGNLAKTNFRFKAWNTAADGSGQVCTPGSAFSMPNNAVTLFAIWEPTYTVMYWGNENTSGIAPVDSGRYAAGDTVIVLGNTGALIKTAGVFSGWNTTANGSGVARPAGSTFAMPASDVNLFAQWGAHSVSPSPNVTGPSDGETDTPYSFTAVDSSCNLGHALEYKFDWGDGSQSNWGSATQSHSWASEGIKPIRAKARCSIETTNETSLGNAWSITVEAREVVSKPNTPTISGSSPYHAGEAYNFTTGASTCNKGHSVNLYRFDWGDGSAYSAWGNATQSHTFPATGGTYYIKAQAKCSAGVISSVWSSSRSVIFVEHTVSRPGRPTGPDKVYAVGNFEFDTTGATCSWGHTVSYLFQWGNGHDQASWGGVASWHNQDWTPHWGINQTFNVRVAARCDTNNAIQELSSARTVKVEDPYDGDPNNTIDAAYNFEDENVWLSDAGGSMGISWDEDWYKVLDKWNGGPFVVECNFKDSNSDIDIYLYAQNGNLVTSSLGTGDMEKIEFSHINPTNRYLYIRVISAGGNYTGNPYNLRWHN